MQQAIDLVLSVIFGLFHLIVLGIASVERVLRDTLAPMGIGTDGQNIVLVLVALALIVGAIRLFGSVFAILITIVLALLDAAHPDAAARHARLIRAAGRGEPDQSFSRSMPTPRVFARAPSAATLPGFRPASISAR